MPKVKKAIKEKMDLVSESLRRSDSPFETRIIEEIRSAYYRGSDLKREGLFRIHDSGDFFHVGYVQSWTNIVRMFPDIIFWAPTREWGSVNKNAVLQAFNNEPNVVLRPSALRFNEKAPVVIGFSQGTAVFQSEKEAKESGHFVCPASKWKHVAGKEFKLLSKEQKQKLASCNGCKVVLPSGQKIGHTNCRACFIKSARRPIAYLKH